MSPETRLISFANWTILLGCWFNSEEISYKIKEENPNTIFCIDGTQYVSLNKMDLMNSRIDLLACSAHKMCAATGIGLLYLDGEMKKVLKPTIYGGGLNKSI